MKTVLLVTGGKTSKELLLEAIERYNPLYLIGADSGLKIFHESGIEPDLCIGDFDSLNEELAKYYKSFDNTVLLKPEKDFTDTEVAVEKIIDMNPDRVVILGATGTRIDHTMANISLLKRFCDAGIEAYIIDANNRIRVITEPVTLRKDAYDFISLMPLGDKVTGLTLSGFKYDVSDIMLTHGVSLGISNEIVKEEASINFSEGYLILMETID